MFEICSALLDPTNAKCCDLIVCFSTQGQSKGQDRIFSTLKCLSDCPDCVCRRTEPPQLCVPSGQQHLLIPPLCEMLVASRIKTLLVLGMDVFLPGFCLAQSAVTAVIWCWIPDCASDSFAGEVADKELSKPSFPHPPLSSSQSLLGHSRNPMYFSTSV